MIGSLLSKVFGTQNERTIKKLLPTAQRVSALEPEVSKLTDAELRAKTDVFRQRIADHLARFPGVDPSTRSAASSHGLAQDSAQQAVSAGLRDTARYKAEQEVLRELLPEAFAVAREAGKRTLRMRHFDMQLIGGVVLHEGTIAEMATGEGKTLVATLPVYLNALTGRGVHVVTVNDYLARRDRQWMGPLYEFLGLSIGVIQHGLNPRQRQEAYGADITYGTNNEYGFDYLRDNMVIRVEDMVQREPNYAIVDEVDSILVDEARTPLIISGPAEESTDKYYQVDRIVPRLEKEKHYQVDEKARNVTLTEDGVRRAEELLGVENLYDGVHIDYVHHINQALRAHVLYQRDVDYVVKDGEVMIVDEFTGRLMPGRRWSDGLHQAIEAKEQVRIERENQTLATITFQNYFRMYRKLAGMTGTASTEAEEFQKIYKLDVVSIPTNRPLIRTNFPDIIYKTEREKFSAVVEEIAELHTKGRPVLVGTISIEKSERLSQMLAKRRVPHHVLNAKYHEREAQIIAQAGRAGGVTIATNMAGRGTDILLGGNPEFLAGEIIRQMEEGGKAVGDEERTAILEQKRGEVAREHDQVVAVGGLHVLGTERHESRRIDNQLRGRSGRQGDPGSSRFYLSLEDDLMRIFGSDRIMKIMDRLGMEEGQDIQHPFVTKAIETAQKRVEAHNFDIRKQLLEYDGVMNKQREVIYAERQRVLRGSAEAVAEHIREMIDDVVDGAVGTYLGSKSPEEWDVKGLVEWARSRFVVTVGAGEVETAPDVEAVCDWVSDRVKAAYAAKEQALGVERMRHLERMVLLHVIDTKWKDHLYAMDNLREGIGLRAYGQRDPLVEYQHEGFAMFETMVASIKEEALELMLKVQPVEPERVVGVFDAVPKEFIHSESSPTTARDLAAATPTAETAGAEVLEGVTMPQRGRTASSARSLGRAPVSKLQPQHRETPKVGRNDPCSCGSGKKYKKCHGQ